MRQKDKIWGLTGGSGSGKTTAANILRDLGATVIDADVLAREVVKPGEKAYNEIVGYFGREYLLENGDINRKKLGETVFSDPERLKILNKITHPAITERVMEIIAKNKDSRIIIDAAALIDCERLKDLCGKIIVVCADKELRITRIMNRDGLTREEAARRIAAQTPQELLIKSADIVIENSGSAEDLRRMVSDSWNK